MKSFFAHLSIGLAVFFGLAIATPLFAAQTLVLDPLHTYVLWHIEHFGFSSQTGKWLASGTLVLDKEHPQNSQVKANIKVSDIITGIPELDKHLRGKLFFDVEKFPTATFSSTQVEVTGKETAKVKGILTLHGISKPITLHVKLNKAGVNPISNKETVGFSAETEIKRSDFGMTALLPGLGDKVKIDIQTEASLAH